FSLGFSDEELVSTIDTDDPEKQKTSGFHLKAAMQHYGWKAEDIIVVGDALSDIKMAHSQNVQCIVVLSGFLERDVALEKGAMAVIESLEGLPELLRIVR